MTARPLADREASDRLVFDRSAGIGRLLEIMARLRAPDGCPWDRGQTWETIAPFTVEEAFEVADAIARGDAAELEDELGDLLLQVVYHARIAEEAGRFGWDEVVRAISDKMLRRHPHVFGTEPGGPRLDPKDFDWEALKAEERAGRGEVRESVLDGVPEGLPALVRALKLTRRAAEVGFDWTDLRDVLAKIAEEAGELVAELEAEAEAKAKAEDAAPGEAARGTHRLMAGVDARATPLDAEPEASGPDGRARRARIEEEYGDLLFVMTNLARHLDVDPESALRRANAKFERRFRGIERALAAAGRRPQDATLEEMDALWDAEKAREKT